jgi:excisionase family DNA binding protein
MSPPTRMNKEQAAEFLKISVRQLQRHMAARRIAYQMVATKHGEEAEFSRDELERFKEQKGRPTLQPALDSKALAARPASALTRQRSDGVIPGLEAFAAFVSAARPQATVTDLAHQLMLSRAEAARLAGVAENQIKLAIASKKLKARIVGRAWRVKRADLEAWVKKL